MICVMRHLALTVSDVCLKHGCFQYSALEVFMRYINSRLTYLLTYLIVTVAVLLTVCEILSHRDIENRHCRLVYSDGRP